MSRYTGPTTRINRRFGMAIFPANKSFERRTYPPGQHGPNFRRKASDYSAGLLEKQKLRLMYGLTEKQFRNLFQKAKRNKELLVKTFSLIWKPGSIMLSTGLALQKHANLQGSL